MTQTKVTFSFRRAALIGENTMRQAAREQYFGFVALLAVLLVAGAQALQVLNFGSSELRFISNIGFSTMAFFCAALTIAATTQFYFAEVEHRTLFTLLSKPILRAEFVLGKFIGVVILAAVFCLLITLVLIGVLWTRENSLMRAVPDSIRDGNSINFEAIFSASVAQWMKLIVLGCLTLLVASFARSPVFTMGAGWMILVTGHLQFVALAAAENVGQSVVRTIVRLVAFALPDFQRFDLSDAITSSHQTPWLDVAHLAFYSVAYCGVVLALAAYSFRHREL
jgi:ABC-type transport system involved in multi-copper enzyme maturation permease subunit